MKVLQKELNKVEKEKEEFIQDFSEVRVLLHNYFDIVFLLWIHLYNIILLIMWNNNDNDDDVQEDYNDIVGGWKAKLVRSSSGEQRWGLFIAQKWYSSSSYAVSVYLFFVEE